MRADSGIRSVRDLAARSVATTGTTSVQHLRRKVRASWSRTCRWARTTRTASLPLESGRPCAGARPGRAA